MRRFAGPAFVLTLLTILCSCLLWSYWSSQRLHSITGDEPHYLVMADGILPTLEFEQTGPYVREFQNRTIMKNGLASRNATPNEENTHAIEGPHGLFNKHNIGLPLLLSAPYLLGGELFARFAMIFAAGAMAFFLTCIGLNRISHRRAAIAATIPLVLSAPVLIGSTQIYPDLVGGTVVAFGLYRMTGTAARSSLMLTLITSVVIAYLPWLHLRFFPLAVTLLVGVSLTNYRQATRSQRYFAVWSPLMLSASLLAAYNSHAFGNALGPYESEDVQTTVFTVMHFLGLLTDQNQGLFIQQPLLLVGVFAIGFVLRKRSTLGITAVLCSVFILGANSSHWALYGGWSLPGRFSWTAYPALVVVTFIGLEQIWLHSPRVFKSVIALSIVFQLFLLGSIVSQRLILLPRALDAWPGTYSLFFPTLERFLPIWTSSDSSFERPGNYPVLILVVSLFLVGLVANDQKTTKKLLSGVTLTVLLLLFIIDRINRETFETKEWEAGSLPSAIGTQTSTSRTASDTDGQGFLTYGPFWYTPIGKYRAEIEFVSSASSAGNIGLFDVYSRTSKSQIVTAQVPNSDGQSQTAVLDFEVRSSRLQELEIRSFYGGQGNLEIKKIRLARVEIAQDDSVSAHRAKDNPNGLSG